MQVRSMECLRRLLRRSGEAMALLSLLSEHHVGRLSAGLDAATRGQLALLTFHSLVCSPAGDQLASKLVAALMEVRHLQLPN